MSLRCFSIFSFFLSTGMLALWRSSGDFEEVREDLTRTNPLTQYTLRFIKAMHAVHKIYLQETKCVRLKK